VIGSFGISELVGAPEITTSGGAGDVLSETGDRLGVVGAGFVVNPVLSMLFTELFDAVEKGDG
jgi:hypothetical protein